MTRSNRLAFSLGIAALLGALIAAPLAAQAGRTTALTRSTPATGLLDTALVVVVDTAGRTRAATVASLRQAITGSATQGAAKGTTTNDTTAAVNVGYFMKHTTAAASQLTLTSTTVANLDSLSLTAGDWDVSGVIFFADSVAKRTLMQAGTDTVSATFSVAERNILSASGGHTAAQDSASSVTNSFVVPTVRYSLSSTTKVYLIASSTFSINKVKAYGTIRARRVR